MGLLFLTACVPRHLLQAGDPCFVPYKNFSFKLCKDFPFKVDGKNYKIPKGFITDFASIPRIFWNIYSPHQANTIKSAIIHDYLYTNAANVQRSYADDVFYNELLQDDVNIGQAILFWVSVRIFGSSSYHKR